MDGFEIAYYLEGRQLLLLLSLIDQRPVAGLPPIEEPEDWGPVALSLLQDRRFRCEGQNLVMDETLSGLLLEMKTAKRICVIYGCGPVPSCGTLYIGGRFVLLEFLPDGKYRLRRTEKTEVRELMEELLMRSAPMPEALEVSLADDAALGACLRRWERRAPGLEETPALWRQFDEVRGVLEYQTSGTKTRWVWIEDVESGVLLCQDQSGAHAKLDTDSQRRFVLRELGMEA